MYVCMYVCMCVCVCMYVCMHTCMHACMFLNACTTAQVGERERAVEAARREVEQAMQSASTQRAEAEAAMAAVEEGRGVLQARVYVSLMLQHMCR